MVLRVVLLVSLLFCSVCRVAAADTSPNVVFLSPDNSRFWQMVAGFMTQVAEDLEVEFDVQFDEERHRLSYLRLVQQVLDREDKPDYLIIMWKDQVTTQILEYARQHKVKVFSFNTAVPEAAREKVGAAPREKLENWIGHLGVDNVSGGQKLARLLEQRALERSLIQPGQPVPIVALTGTLDSSAARDRIRGLLEVTDGESAQLLQSVRADWSEVQARDKTSVLLKRYPNMAVVWSASDGMALGAIDAAKRAGRHPGKDLVVGGVDWEPEALAAIRTGELHVSLGRHFMGGGLALLLVHDYHRGYDFADSGQSASLHYQFQAATADNVDEIAHMLAPENWKAVDFRAFSRVFNSQLREVPVSADGLMDGFSAALVKQPIR
ncbi:sugar ABC transporter substrate-binding protein [Marinobacter sp. EN3]|jgi:ABC-type sugar transport system substrate-binding protein|uniref:ABC transporter substrate-binding protein n=1 Tax=Marinobacter sp. EN3 TaxID=1397533 RepID=UPI0003B85990|nr:ABC transporter substrate-binding protein [Marinobacter sp. EN3]ERS08748.1 sugar ABC transporter substrate-binding protein [Marinobacter sp. EN3]